MHWFHCAVSECIHRVRSLPLLIAHLLRLPTHAHWATCAVPAGKRMVLEDWSECPSCRFACTRQNFLRVLGAEAKCPMCHEEVRPIACAT